MLLRLLQIKKWKTMLNAEKGIRKYIQMQLRFQKSTYNYI